MKHPISEQIKGIQEARNILVASKLLLQQMSQHQFFQNGYKDGSASISEVMAAADSEYKAYSNLFDLVNGKPNNLDEKLNDAGSTIAAINLANIKFDAAISGFASPEELTAKP